ncbi:MAG: ribbon-helix-helix domain-containing protein [Rhodovibrionaceae bacterium]|nr:ribbon-helix-helix domain-containing protein [Rhodovibrionaceae bacterium]
MSEGRTVTTVRGGEAASCGGRSPDAGLRRDVQSARRRQPERKAETGGSTLVCRNVIVDGRRTSLRLERLMWEALAEICRREGASRAEICTLVEARRRESSLTAAVRVYILSYFRAAATEQGHADAGHGSLA